MSNMMFTIKGDEFDTPYIDDWRTAKTQTADALATGDRRRDLKVEEAEAFLMKHLDGQTLFVEDVKKLAEKENIHERNIYRAKNNLPISDDYDNKGQKFWTFDKAVKPKRMKDL